MAILMCRPDYFDIEYEINPWMHTENRVDTALAMQQWQTLYDTYVRLGEKVELIEQVKGLPDMVFTANCAVIWNNHVVITHFTHPQRQGEEEHFQRYFEHTGMKVSVLDKRWKAEGAGDFMFLGDHLYCGSGFRSDFETHEIIATLLGVKYTSVKLVEGHFYHLDTCFAPIDDETAMIYAPAFTPESVEIMRQQIPRLIEVPQEVGEGFACNATAVGNTVVSSEAIAGVRDELAAIGYDVIGLPMSEFMKSGGAVRCLTLPLDLGAEPASQVRAS